MTIKEEDSLLGKPRLKLILIGSVCLIIGFLIGLTIQFEWNGNLKKETYPKFFELENTTTTTTII